MASKIQIPTLASMGSTLSDKELRQIRQQHLQALASPQFSSDLVEEGGPGSGVPPGVGAIVGLLQSLRDAGGPSRVPKPVLGLTVEQVQADAALRQQEEIARQELAFKERALIAQQQEAAQDRAQAIKLMKTQMKQAQEMAGLGFSQSMVEAYLNGEISTREALAGMQYGASVAEFQEAGADRRSAAQVGATMAGIQSREGQAEADRTQREREFTADEYRRWEDLALRREYNDRLAEQQAQRSPARVTATDILSALQKADAEAQPLEAVKANLHRLVDMSPYKGTEDAQALHDLIDTSAAVYGQDSFGTPAEPEVQRPGLYVKGRRLNPAVKAAMDDPTRERLETVILED